MTHLSKKIQRMLGVHWKDVGPLCVCYSVWIKEERRAAVNNLVFANQIRTSPSRDLQLLSEMARILCLAETKPVFPHRCYSVSHLVKPEEIEGSVEWDHRSPFNMTSNRLVPLPHFMPSGWKITGNIGMVFTGGLFWKMQSCLVLICNAAGAVLLRKRKCLQDGTIKKPVRTHIILSQC